MWKGLGFDDRGRQKVGREESESASFMAFLGDEGRRRYQGLRTRFGRMSLRLTRIAYGRGHSTNRLNSLERQL